MQAYFEHYAQAFLARDVAAIERHFAYPCLMINEAGTDVLSDPDALAQHVKGFVERMAQSGVARIDVLVRDQTQPDANHATAVVAYTLKDAAGHALNTFSFLYVLENSRARGWQIRLAQLLDA